MTGEVKGYLKETKQEVDDLVSILRGNRSNEVREIGIKLEIALRLERRIYEMRIITLWRNVQHLSRSVDDVLVEITKMRGDM